jgi:hypothetical protein
VKHIPLIVPDDQSVAELNQWKREKFLPQLWKYCFNPAKLSAYREQLGINYPRVNK